MIKILIAAGCLGLGLFFMVIQILLDPAILQPVGVFGTFFSGIGIGLLSGKICE